jgi:hypothetical protein
MSLVACGGGGVGSEGGIGGSGISMGVMQDQNASTNTAKVNGITFDTTYTSYSEEGGSASEANIQPGMVVVVQGSIDPVTMTGTADSIAYADLLEGPITAITATSISSMGQTILVDGATIYSGSGVTGLASLANGDVIEVSGFFTATGNIYATYVERTGSSSHEIKGVITAVNAGVSFNIGNLQVNWANTTGLNVDDFVQANGMMSNATTLVATSVNALSQNLAVADADEAEVEGLVTGTCIPSMPPLSTPCTFQLGFVTVQVTDTTQIDGGLLADIQPGVRIEVEGALSNNVVIANKIEFKDSVELVSNTSAKGTDTLTLEFGTNDVTVRYDPLVTELNGYAAFSDIVVGDHLKVRARKAGTELIATRIEDNTGNTELELQGPADTVLLPFITVLGVTVDTTGFIFKDQNGVDISQVQFFVLLGTNTLVKVQGDIGATNLINWVSIEIEQ